MRKFKLFFYPIYLIVAFVVLYYSIDILANMDLYKEKVDFAMLRTLPEYLLYLLLAVSLLMITELAVENWHILSLRRRVRQAEEDLLKLKAKLFDRSQEYSPGDDDEEDDLDLNAEDDEDEK